MVSVAGTTYFTLSGSYVYAVICGLVIFISLFLLSKSYRRFNQNILFLLNALENGDYSFHFSETKLSAREKELNNMLNRIKEILVNARKEVIENEKFLSMIVESVSMGILIIDDRGIVQMVNQSTLDLFGLPVFTHINQLNSIDEKFPALFHSLQAGDNIHIPASNEREELQLSLNVSLIKLKRGVMRVITIHNIGNELENKEMESWIRLIRVMTHEIMNSIAPITSLSETLLSLLKADSRKENENILKQNTIDAFETINSTASGLLSFVESYRKFTSVPKPEKKYFPAGELIQKVVQLYNGTIREKDIELIINSNDDIYLFADPKLITQVLVNLVKNSIEALEKTANKKLIIKIEKHKEEKVTIEVMNTGEPIPADVLAHIFIPFFTTKDSGSGIGLSVSRYIMRLHGGKLQHLQSSDGMTVFQLSVIIYQ